MGNRNGIQPVKTSASKSLGMAVNVSGRGTAQTTMWVRRVLACPVRMLRIRMTRDSESRRQPAKKADLAIKTVCVRDNIL